ncbi:MAG: UDP-N-acetylmuramate dehydrogenase [Polyangiaceae bacterium]|nr:UDP-N-acetylmuramate dehydrogenase [Polyangiaceae bacterium]
MRQLHNIPLADLTTMQVGGPANHVVDVESESELTELLEQLDATAEPVAILSGGSNVIAHDSGWPGTIIRPAIKKLSANSSTHHIALEIGAGESWDDIVATTVEKNWAGLASLSGIPGWCGAAPIQNIGAYGTEIGKRLASVKAFDRQTHRFTTIAANQCALDYRTSLFKHNPRYIITEITIQLDDSREERVCYSELAIALGVEVGTHVPTNAVRSAVLELRRSKGMVVDAEDPESRSTGSYFVNPIVSSSELARIDKLANARHSDATVYVPRFQLDESRFKIPAAWLIEQAGFHKGLTIRGIGGAGISNKHALAIVNRGGRCSDVLALEEAIRAGVHSAFGVILEREPVLLQYTGN